MATTDVSCSSVPNFPQCELSDTLPSQVSGSMKLHIFPSCCALTGGKDEGLQREKGEQWVTIRLAH